MKYLMSTEMGALLLDVAIMGTLGYLIANQLGAVIGLIVGLALHLYLCVYSD